MMRRLGAPKLTGVGMATLRTVVMVLVRSVMSPELFGLDPSSRGKKMVNRASRTYPSA
jgi:hypothetical protein